MAIGRTVAEVMHAANVARVNQLVTELALARAAQAVTKKALEKERAAEVKSKLKAKEAGKKAVVQKTIGKGKAVQTGVARKSVQKGVANARPADVPAPVDGAARRRGRPPAVVGECGQCRRLRLKLPGGGHDHAWFCQKSKYERV